MRVLKDPNHVHFTQSIRDQIDHTYSNVSHQLTDSENPDIFILQCSPMVSEAMVEHIPEIERLSKMDGGLRLVFDLLPYLGKHSFVGDYISMDDKRKSDAPAHELFLPLTKRMKENACFTLVRQFDELHKQRKFPRAFISDISRGGNRKPL
jgi:hypothetical protein